ncbi:hypothetical protein BC826DRAFT_1102896 [Russula brevipes]|nr:hypothetical protein BC826DRAFT_1102896 [Russula brevipes]
MEIIVWQHRLTISFPSMDDPIRELNNYLQGVMRGVNLVPLLIFTSAQEGPNNQAVHTGTYKFRGKVVGTGVGAAIAIAKRIAATHALQYFRANGIPQ